MELIPLKIHRLKTWPSSFYAVWGGTKRYEVRKNDRSFQLGDYLFLEAYDPPHYPGDKGSYLGKSILARVDYISHGPEWGLPSGLCVMSIKVLEKLEGKASIFPENVSAGEL